MAYNRKTTKTGPKSRRTTTTNTNGPSTYSTSTSTGSGVTYTQTSKNGKYYTTRTQRMPDGSVVRERVQSSTSKPKSNKSSKTESGESFGGVLLLMIGLVIMALIFA